MLVLVFNGTFFVIFVVIVIVIIIAFIIIIIIIIIVIITVLIIRLVFTSALLIPAVPWASDPVSSMPFLIL